MQVRLILIAALLSSLVCFRSQAQEKEHLLKEDTKGMDFLMMSVDYLTNSNVINNLDNQVKQPSISPSAALITWWGLDFTVSSDIIGHSDDSLIHSSSDFNVTAGYNLKPHKNWTIHPFITRTFYSNNTNSFRKIFKTDIHTDIDYHYKFMNAGISAGYLSGSSHTFYAGFSNSYEITLNDFLFREAALVIQPGVDLNFGDYEYLNYFYLDQLEQYPGFYVKLLTNSRALRRYVIAEKISHPDMTYQQIMDDLLRNKAKDSFKLTSVSASLTALYMTGRIGINLGVLINLPVSHPDYIENNTLIYFNAGLSYFLDF